VLSLTYPEVPFEQREPGAPLPQRDPVVVYYRAFCREKLGEPAAADYAVASSLPAAYVFPSGAQTLEVLEAAVRARPGDASAHFLLGTLQLASGLTDDAIQEWGAARRMDPAIPVLAASLGRALLRIKHDTQAALDAFRAGLDSDPANIELYAGMDATLSMLGRPAEERVAALERHPDQSNIPTSLAYDLALSYAEASRFDKAKAMFENRFFARAEGGANVRQVWIQVRAMEAQWNAQHNGCDAALAIVDHLRDAAPGLTFTRDGLDPFVNQAPIQSALGSVESRCGRAAAAAQRLEKLVKSADPASIVFGYDLARRAPGFRREDWAARLDSILTRATANAVGGSSWPSTVLGLLQIELGHAEQGRETLRGAILMPDSNLAHHYSRAALVAHAASSGLK